MSFKSNVEEAFYTNKYMKESFMRRYVKLVTPDYIESYDKENDVLIVVSHYYGKPPFKQMTFEYSDGCLIKKEVRPYSSTKGLTTIQQAYKNINSTLQTINQK